MSDAGRDRYLAVALALLAGLLVYWLAVDLFPYHSVNDDEGVYLTQAAMLLDGRLFLRPGALGDLVRPWFFVAHDGAEGLAYYPKYSPVPAAMFAVGRLLGGVRLALGLVAAGTAALVYTLSTDAFDRRVGTLATLALVGSPLFLFTTAVFLPYAPATLLNVAFAAAYVRTMRRRSPRWGVAAGVAVGLAFFARPYTAVLFASPFLAHALASLWRTLGSERFRQTLARLLAVAIPGLGGVLLTLGYNAVVTGDPLLFPYEAFAPRDGLGFGHRELLGYDRQYTPALAVETTVRLLRTLTTEWTVAGPVGTLLALVGLRRLRGTWRTALDPDLPPAGLRVLLALLVPAVVLGNAYFWGTLNGLNNGLIGLLGPYYHFDLLLPLSAFAAAGALDGWRAVADAVRERLDRRTARVALAVLLVLSVGVVAGAEASVVSDPYGENRQRTTNLAATYAPFEERSLDHAVVFVPDPYGDWLQHPFQHLRNDPGFDGDAVFVRDEGASETFRALDATGDRRPYRFTYRGEWTGAVDPVTPALKPLAVERGERVNATATLGVPARATHARIRLEGADGAARYEVGSVEDAVTVSWTVGPTDARVTSHPPAGDASAVPLPRDASEVRLLVTFVEPQGTTVTYRLTAVVDRGSDAVRVVWPPETRVCSLTTDCGRAGTYVGPQGEYVSGVSVTTNATAVTPR